MTSETTEAQEPEVLDPADAAGVPIVAGDGFEHIEDISSVEILFRERADGLTFEQKAKVNAMLQAISKAIKDRRDLTRDLLEKAILAGDVDGFDVEVSGATTTVKIPGVKLKLKEKGGEKYADADKTRELLERRDLLPEKIDQVVVPVAHKIDLAGIFEELNEKCVPADEFADISARPDFLTAMRFGRFLADVDIDFEDYVVASKYEVNETLLEALSFSDVLTDDELEECYEISETSYSLRCSLQGKLKSRVVTAMCAD